MSRFISLELPIPMSLIPMLQGKVSKILLFFLAKEHYDDTMAKPFVETQPRIQRLQGVAAGIPYSSISLPELQ